MRLPGLARYRSSSAGAKEPRLQAPAIDCPARHRGRNLAWLLWLPLAAVQADGLGGSVGVATDDVFRGVSESEGQLSPRGELHGMLGSWFAGASAEEVRIGFGGHAGAELVAYAGFQHDIGEQWTAQISARHYDYYPGSNYRARYNYDEAGLSLGWQQRIVVSAIASPDTYRHDYQGNFGSGSAYAYEVGARQPLPLGLVANLGAGWYDLRHQIGAGYAYWNAGISRRWSSWAADLRYVGTDGTARYHFEDDAGDRVVFSLFWTF